MDVRKMGLKGSPSLDEFKQWHKTGDGRFYAADADLILLSKTPPGIVAVLDYKDPRTDTRIAFGSALMYTDIMSRGIPVFIVESVPPFQLLTVKEIVLIDYRPSPPKAEFRILLENGSGGDFFTWERSLRAKYRDAHEL